MKEYIQNFLLQLVNDEPETQTKHKTSTKKDICLAYSIISNIALILGIIFAIPQAGSWFAGFILFFCCWMHNLYTIKEIWVYALNDICFWFVFPHWWFIARNNLFEGGRSVRNSAMCILAAKATTVGFWTLIYTNIIRNTWTALHGIFC